MQQLKSERGIIRSVARVADATPNPLEDKKL